MNKREELEIYFAKYPELSPVLIIKLSVTKNGIIFSDEALKRLQKEDYRFTKAEPFGISLDIRKEDFYTPGAVFFRDGSSVLVNLGEPYVSPYVVAYDKATDQFLLTEDGVVIDVIDFLPPPAFFTKTTGRGTPMDHVGGTCTGQRLLINAFQHCRFWERGEQCHYCALFSADSVLNGEVDLHDISETVHEAWKEPGRFTEISISGGSDFSGDPPFSVEQERYIRVLHAVSRDFTGKREIQLMAPAYPKEDIKRIYDITSLTSYRPNIEVWDETSFKRLCPGKEHWIGRKEWIRRTCDAVEVFGKGRVYTQMVCGAELAGKDATITHVDQAVEAALEGSEFFSKNGVSCHVEVWRPHKREKLGWQEMQDLDYFIRLSVGFHDNRVKYGICEIPENYMRGSDNPDADIERGDRAKQIPLQDRHVSASMSREEYTAVTIPENIRDMITDKDTGIYLMTDPFWGFQIAKVYTLDERFIMLPLRSDRSLLSSFLTRCVWFRNPATLYFLRGDMAFCLQVSVFKHSLVGKEFRQTLECVRRDHPAEDMAAAAELHLLSVERCDRPKIRILDDEEVAVHRHLDRQ